ncbi:hypothetical protein [Gilvimarinus algae]|uniref:YcxB-like protein domain-containing protein n=1 Tax=Gilvimarinus algae TaxID=3058037 RepID=A0ABT8TCC4_9GAMM|nr:hypothetical protein [Gilvimarinus sp. SDUM040014]MDO3381295.1 hypothetical protein [Gilvimarinus sp. SDUM040014]
MFKKFINRARQQRREALNEYYNKIYATVNDEAARDVRWLPLAEGGSSGMTYALKKSGPGHYRFEPGWFLKILAHTPLFLGSALLVRQLYRLAVAEDLTSLWGAVAFWGAVALVLIVVGLFSLRHIYSAPTVELTRGQISRKHMPMPAFFERLFPGKNYYRISFDDVLALQILAERCSSQDDSSARTFISYELILVLKKRKRVLLVDHGNLEVIQSDARTLSSLLGVPVWDGSAHPLESLLVRPF